MDQPDTAVIEFLRSNLILIGIVLLVIFGYLVMLVRKRWRQGFLHTGGKDDPKR
jgi:hypothetical protein